MAISIQEHSNALTSKVVGAFDEVIPVKAGFSAWFPRETTPTLLVDVHVRRGTRKIAVDVLRFTEGNKNKLSRFTEKKYQPPFYREEYDFVRDEIYMNTVAMGVMNAPNANRAIAQNAVKAIQENRDMIERAIQKQQAEVLQTGIVTLSNGDNIDYKRKAESMVDVDAAGGDYWSASATAKPLNDIAAAGLFLRNVGNSSGNTLNVIGRTTAMNAFFATTQVRDEADIRRIERVQVGMPQFQDATGFTFYGQIGAGDFVVNLWTYNEMYEDEDGNTVYYLDEDNVIVLPDDFMGKTVFGGLPSMATTTIGGASTMIPAVVEAEFLLRGYFDEKTISSTLELTSAPLVIPFTIDKIYTMKVLA